MSSCKTCIHCSACMHTKDSLTDPYYNRPTDDKTNVCSDYLPHIRMSDREAAAIFNALSELYDQSQQDFYSEYWQGYADGMTESLKTIFAIPNNLTREDTENE